MHKTDARRLKHGELTELRKRAVTAVQRGESAEVVARTFGVTRAAVYGWLARYRAGGWGALDASKRGGRPAKLSAKQIEWIYSGTTWAPRGKTPIVSTTGARFGTNLISAVSRRGDFRSMCVSGRVNAKVFVTFLRRLLYGVDDPIFLIVDGHPTHESTRQTIS